MSLDSWTSTNTNTNFNGNIPSLSSEAAMNAWLWRLMQKEKNRDMIARLEDNLHSFVMNDKDSSLTFPPRSAFHRRVCYAVARRYGLDHRLEEGEPSPGAQNDDSSGESVRLVLIKTPYSAPPLDRLADFANGPPPVASAASSTSDLPIMATACLPSPCPSKAVAAIAIVEGEASASRPATFLRRPRTADGKSLRVPLVNGAQSLSANGSATLKRITEEDYQKARARIFKMNDNSTELTSLVQVEGGSDIICEDPGNIVRADGAGVAKGPVEGSRGFERRRNRRGGAGISSVGNTQVVSANGSDTRVVRRTNSSADDSDESKAIPDGTDVRAGRSVLPVPRGTKDNCRIGNGSGGNGGGQSLGNTSLATTGRRYASEGNLGDLQDPDFDRSYIKWARRESMSSTNAPQGNGMGFPMYSAHMIYPYAGTQSMAHHAIHGGPLTIRSSPGLTAGLPHHAAPGLAHFHHGALIHASNGGMFGPIPQTQRSGSGQGVVSSDFSTHSTSAGLTCSGGDCVPGSNPGRGMVSNAIPSQSIPNQANASYGISSINDGIGLRMRTVVSHPQHHISWTPQSVPMTIRTPPAPAYGLDSTVDFPPLR